LHLPSNDIAPQAEQRDSPPVGLLQNAFPVTRADLKQVA